MGGETNILATRITELFSAKQWYKYLPWEGRPTCWQRVSENCSQPSNGTSTYHERGDQHAGHENHRTVLSQAMVQLLTMRGETNMLATRITELFSAKQWYKYLPWEERPTCWPRVSQNCSQPSNGTSTYHERGDQHAGHENHRTVLSQAMVQVLTMRGETNMLATRITELFSAKQWYKYLPWEGRPTCWPRESRNCSQPSNGTSTYHERRDQHAGHENHRTVLSQVMVQVLTMRGETNMLATRITELFSAK